MEFCFNAFKHSFYKEHILNLLAPVHALIHFNYGILFLFVFNQQTA